MNKLIVIVGPTSSHKSALALKISKMLNYPLVNADAFQVYKELNAGTNKMDKDTIKNTPVYLMDCISIYDDWNIKVFQDEAKKILATIYKNKQIPIIVGGSNLYVDALIKNYDLSSSSKRTNSYEDMTNEQLHQLLQKLDPAEAKKIPANNRKRVIRAIQIIEETGMTKTSKDVQRKKYFYDCLVVYMDVERAKLYETINNRVLEMIDLGWRKEVEDLIKKDKDVMKLNALKALGYQEVYDAIKNKTSINTDLIAQKTRRYAKRQVTWCKHQYPKLFSYHGPMDDDLLRKTIEGFIND
ncbi:MAG: tRNA (adenosine(37)-N6)-dimethylallyltransferase MiaA [Mycoplasmoidaceae bacterium]